MCRDAPTLAETAPGFTLPKSAPRVLLLAPGAPTPFQQSVTESLRYVVVRQGGVLTADPRAADLLMSGQVSFFAKQKTSIIRAPMVTTGFGSAYSLVAGQSAWSLNRFVAVADVPIAIPKTVEYAKAQIDIFAPEGYSSARHVWHAELQAEP